MGGHDHTRSDLAGRPKRRQRKDRDDQIETAIQKAGSIGALEQLAGIPQDPDSRTAFWMRFKHLPGGAALDAGCAELKRLIRSQGEGTRG